jgi:heme exporter protein D
MAQRQFEIIGGHGAVVWDYTTATTVTAETNVIAELRAEIALLKEENERLHLLLKTMRQ